MSFLMPYIWKKDHAIFVEKNIKLYVQVLIDLLAAQLFHTSSNKNKEDLCKEIVQIVYDYLTKNYHTAFSNNNNSIATHDKNFLLGYINQIESFVIGGPLLNKQAITNNTDPNNPIPKTDPQYIYDVTVKPEVTYGCDIQWCKLPFIQDELKNMKQEEVEKYPIDKKISIQKYKDLKNEKNDYIEVKNYSNKDNPVVIGWQKKMSFLDNWKFIELHLVRDIIKEICKIYLKCIAKTLKEEKKEDTFFLTKNGLFFNKLADWSYNGTMMWNLKVQIEETIKKQVSQVSNQHFPEETLCYFLSQTLLRQKINKMPVLSPYAFSKYTPLSEDFVRQIISIERLKGLSNLTIELGYGLLENLQCNIFDFLLVGIYQNVEILHGEWMDLCKSFLIHRYYKKQTNIFFDVNKVSLIAQNLLLNISNVILESVEKAFQNLNIRSNSKPKYLHVHGGINRVLNMSLEDLKNPPKPYKTYNNSLSLAVGKMLITNPLSCCKIAKLSKSTCKCLCCLDLGKRTSCCGLKCPSLCCSFLCCDGLIGVICRNPFAPFVGLYWYAFSLMVKQFYV